MRINGCLKPVVLAAAAGLCGCLNRYALQHDYANFSEVYGDSVNRQLLLNLAREAHEEPAYFLQLASISSQYQFTTSAGFNASDVRTAPTFNPVSGAKAVENAATFGGSANASVLQQPIFQFLPLTGSNYVAALLTPITERVYWTFYDQGWPADQLARTMLVSIEKQTATYTNNGSTNHAYTVYANDPTDSTYPEFLKLCNDFNNAQRFHLLVVDKNGKGDEASLVFSNKTASLNELVAATAAGLSVRYDDKSAHYIVRKDIDRIDFLEVDTNLEINGSNPIHRFYVGGGTGTVGTDASFGEALGFAREYRSGKIRLTTRTFEEALNAVANEQRFFRRSEGQTNSYGMRTITFRKDPFGTIAIVETGIPNYPPFPVRPILVLEYPEPQRARLSKLTQVSYAGETYTIGDLQDLDWDAQVQQIASPGWKDELRYQNRTVFSILSYLFSQTAIDTSKLPIQQLIQVQ